MCIFHFKGSGKQTLARKLAQIWKCIFIEGKHNTIFGTLHFLHNIFWFRMSSLLPVIQNGRFLNDVRTTGRDQVTIFPEMLLLKNGL